jgi:hypothetical protein
MHLVPCLTCLHDSIFLAVLRPQNSSMGAQAASIYFLLDSPPISRSLSLHVDPRPQKTVGQAPGARARAGCGSGGRQDLLHT